MGISREKNVGKKLASLNINTQSLSPKIQPNFRDFYSWENYSRYLNELWALQRIHRFTLTFVLCKNSVVPNKGIASETWGRVSATRFRNTVSDSKMVTPETAVATCTQWSVLVRHVRSRAVSTNISSLLEEDVIVDRQPLVLSPCRSSTKRNRAELNHRVSIDKNKNLSLCNSNAMKRNREKGGEEREYSRYVAVDCKPEQSFATRLDGIVDGNLAGVVPPCRFIGDVSSIISKREPSISVPKGSAPPKIRSALLCSTSISRSGSRAAKNDRYLVKDKRSTVCIHKLICKFAYVYLWTNRNEMTLKCFN